MKRVLIIAEAGVNHNGKFDLACRLVDAAAEAGADYVKFQTFKAERLVTSAGRTADYQKRNCEADSQLAMLRSLELPFEAFRELAQYCRAKGIGFLSTPFDGESIRFLASLGMDFMKVPSGEITNLPYLRMIADTKLPVIISTGMSTLADVEGALAVFYERGYTREMITLLHCNTEYPTPMRDVNLRAMETLRASFGVDTGYSDHTRGIEVPIAAVALGATVIEKHFTLDHNLPGPDHVASLEPAELKRMVTAVRNVESALGTGLKRVSDSERGNMAVARKSIVAARDIVCGEVLSAENLTVKRPGDGLSPMLWDMVCGRRAIRNFTRDEQIEI
jgi:N,N'-diacetyllegionaminate synthase